MKTKLLWLIMALFVMASAFGQNTTEKKVAILQTVDSYNTLSPTVKLTVRSKLTTAITRTSGYRAFDRIDISAILDEQNFQRTGMVTKEQIKRLGEMAGVDYVLIAEAAMDSRTVSIEAKLNSVETGEIVQSADEQPNNDPDAITAACQELAAKLLNVPRGRNITFSNNNSYASPSSYSQDFVETAAGLNMKMVYVEGGSFQMGATAEQGSDGESDEQVIRRVRLDSYYIGECEITQAQWTKVMGTSVEQQRDKADSSWPLFGVGSDYPMYYVSWEEAMTFCRELSRMTGRTYTLPTEAQWEYAARGGKKADGTKYSGSWSIDAVAWYDGNSGGGTHPVRNKRANGLGLYDMSGNVWEWCSDWYSNTYNVNDTNNPTGPSSGSYRVGRGGSWSNDARDCRVSYRYCISPGGRHGIIGFRVVLIP